MPPQNPTTLGPGQSGGLSLALDSWFPAGPTPRCATVGKSVSLSGLQAPSKTDQGSVYPSVASGVLCVPGVLSHLP